MATTTWSPWIARGASPRPSRGRASSCSKGPGTSPISKPRRPCARPSSNSRLRRHHDCPLDDSRYNDYDPGMRRRLRDEIQQSRPFETLEEEVYLEILRTSQVAGRWVVEALRMSGLTPAQFNVLRIL